MDRLFVSADSYGVCDEPRCPGHWTSGFRLHCCDGREGARCPPRTPAVSAARAPAVTAALPARRPRPRVLWWSPRQRGRRGAQSPGTRRGTAQLPAGASHPEGRTRLSPPLKAPCLESQRLPGPDRPPGGCSWRRPLPQGTTSGHCASAVSAFARLLRAGGTGTFPSLLVSHGAAAAAPGVLLTAPRSPSPSPFILTECPWTLPEPCSWPTLDASSGGFRDNQFPRHFRRGRIGLCEVTLG